MEDLIWAFSPFLSRLLVFDLVEAAIPLVGVKLGFIPLFSATFAVKDIGSVANLLRFQNFAKCERFCP